ncbi:GNAT family N-acetyltransferase [Pelagovum pacificum]|uniref:GNAT family N-acetyltransferase n=1 Tax=Pelagovum pacificum TaxID=2588711 RepID=A0A5C5GGI4_9RHOB|nr:GNAT family N-acetyltransferase [Pelagovum pacificum]QQA43003.1 GNAT family N-acetyltransferase [Pelagovum pacificum]TNY33852.1 GNAT family N-acetyltransferase [Pelagovum pacificum]
MKIERIEEMRLDRAKEAEAESLIQLCFPRAGFGGRSFHGQRHHVRILAWDDGLVGHMAMTYRAIRVGDRLVDMVGLAEVCTHPDRRGEGIAGKMLEAAIAEAKASPASVFLLFGNAGLYAANGFVAKQNPLRWLDRTGARTNEVKEGPSDGLMVMALDDTPWDDDALVDVAGSMF